LHFVFLVLMPFIPFKLLAPWCFGFFPQTLISLHSNIEKTFSLKAWSRSFLSQEKTKIHMKTQSYQLLKPPHHKNGAWDLCLTNILPWVIYNDECWKWSLHVMVIDGWNGTKVSILDWMQIIPRCNVGPQFSILH
jgi:hypothetical protein